MKLIPVSLILVAGFVLGGLIFKTTTPQHCGLITPGDHIFVLTGDARRIPFALDLLEKNPKTNLHIIGLGANSFKISPESLRKRTDFENKSKNTFENAIAVKNVAEKHALRRIILVTTEDHMNRAIFLISRQLPDVSISACPVPLTGMTSAHQLERWNSEYMKYIGAIFGFTKRA